MLVEIETAAFADAAIKAARVAPTKGAAFDRAAGLMLEVDPSLPDRPVTLKATNLDSTLLARLSTVRCEGPAGRWRVPAALLAGLMGQLPMGAGLTVTLEPVKDKLRLTAGRSVTNLVTIDLDSFPRFAAFDETGLEAVPHFAQSVAQVAWAVDPSHDVFSGIHIDGRYLVACDRYKLAEVKCKVPVDVPITTPLSALSGSLKNTAEVRMLATKTRLLMMPDVDVQATSLIFAQPYPSVQAIRDKVGGHTRTVEVSVEGLCDILRRQMVLCKGDRYPQVKVTFSDGAMAVLMDVPDLGTMSDELDCVGGSGGSVEIWFTPTYLVPALTNAETPKVTIAYGTSLEAISITDGVGYRCIVMPRTPGSAS